MKIQRLKGLFWLGSIALGGYLVYYVVDFLVRQKPVLDRGISVAQQKELLDSIKKPAERENDVIGYETVKQIFHVMDWTGEPPPEKPVAVSAEPAAPPKVAIGDLLKVLAIKVDTADPKGSLGWVKYTDEQLSARVRTKEDAILRIDERLPAPHQGVRVQDIMQDGLVFAFDDPEREPEIVAPSDYPSDDDRIVVVEPGGAIVPQVERRVAVNADFKPYNPELTTLVKKNEYKVGTQTLQDMNDDYPRILAEDVGYRTHRNKSTGAVDGIEVTRVAPGSLPEQHGLTEGEILKKINDHKVTSVNDAIAYVKSNAERTDVWVATFEKQGREFTRTYHSPNR